MRIYTIGHSNRSTEELLAVLADARIEVVVDVRRVPHSGRWPQFGRTALETALLGAGVRYAWEGDELGGKREWSAGAVRHSAIDRDFAPYAAHMESREFRGAVERVRTMARRERVALLCAEREPADCHRSYIADYLCAAGAEVVHLIRMGERVAHALRAQARPEGDGLVYDRSGQGQLELGM